MRRKRQGRATRMGRAFGTKPRSTSSLYNSHSNLFLRPSSHSPMPPTRRPHVPTEQGGCHPPPDVYLWGQGVGRGCAAADGGYGGWPRRRLCWPPERLKSVPPGRKAHGCWQPDPVVGPSRPHHHSARSALVMIRAGPPCPRVLPGRAPPPFFRSALHACQPSWLAFSRAPYP